GCHFHPAVDALDQPDARSAGAEDPGRAAVAAHLRDHPPPRRRAARRARPAGGVDPAAQCRWPRTRHPHRGQRMKTSLLAAAVWAAASGEITQPVPSVASVRALAERQAELRLYGLIGDFFWEGITAEPIAAQPDDLDVDTILVTINSRGGEVDHGTAIYNALKRHKARIVVRVDGQAGSIASLIAMAGDEVVMPPTALMMIHAP